jgi:hypothetical protein
MLDEAQGCEVLARVFAARGFRVARDVAFCEGGVQFVADGWDAETRVGFEYLTHAAGDHLDLRPEELAELEARMQRGELFFFVIDETDVGSEADLAWAAERFLDEVKRRQAGGARP